MTRDDLEAQLRASVAANEPARAFSARIRKCGDIRRETSRVLLTEIAAERVNDREASLRIGAGVADVFALLDAEYTRRACDVIAAHAVAMPIAAREQLAEELTKAWRARR